MTSHFDSQDTTGVEQEMLSEVQTGNQIQHDEYNICDIAHRKEDIFVQRQLIKSFFLGVGPRDQKLRVCNLNKNKLKFSFYINPLLGCQEGKQKSSKFSVQRRENNK